MLAAITLAQLALTRAACVVVLFGVATRPFKSCLGTLGLSESCGLSDCRLGGWCLYPECDFLEKVLEALQGACREVLERSFSLHPAVLSLETSVYMTHRLEDSGPFWLGPAIFLSPIRKPSTRNRLTCLQSYARSWTRRRTQKIPYLSAFLPPSLLPLFHFLNKSILFIVCL